MIVASQVAAGTAPGLLVRVPAGISSLSLIGGSLGTYYGGSGVTTANGALLPAGAVVTIPGYATSAPVQLYVATSAGATPVSFFLSTPE